MARTRVPDGRRQHPHRHPLWFTEGQATAKTAGPHTAGEEEDYAAPTPQPSQRIVAMSGRSDTVPEEPPADR